jgi:hypothetical protein
MKYWDGQEVKVGDKVKYGGVEGGIVVSSMDTDEYSEEHPKEQWSYLKEGVMIEVPTMGLIHFVEPDEDLELISRAPQQESS